MTEQFEVPTLLLGYTYFLNEKHNAYLNMGFDSMTLKHRIILFKNNQFVEIEKSDWITLLASREKITDFFYNNTLFEINSTLNSSLKWKLSRRKEGRILSAVHLSGKRISICFDEWTLLCEFSDFLNSVFLWILNFEPNIKIYYTEYLHKCIEMGTLHLPADKFFILSSCNFSRLFAELPVLSKIKLQIDHHLAVNRDTVN